MPTMDVREAKIEISPNGAVARLTLRGALDLEPTVIHLPYPLLEGAVAAHMSRRCAAQMQRITGQGATPPIIGPDGASPAARSGP